SGEIEGIGIAVGRLIDRARQRRLQEPMVAQSSTAAMLGNLFVVNGEDQRFADPSPFGHFASSRRARRCFFITFRASVICRSKSGSCGVSRKPSGVSVK